jgi:hypothetical protein
MAQFDVHRNPGRHRDRIPFVVVVQSSLYDGYRRRVVVPLDGSLYVFINRRGIQMRVLYFDRSGFCVWAHLEATLHFQSTSIRLIPR